MGEVGEGEAELDNIFPPTLSFRLRPLHRLRIITYEDINNPILEVLIYESILFAVRRVIMIHELEFGVCLAANPRLSTPLEWCRKNMSALVDCVFSAGSISLHGEP